MAWHNYPKPGPKFKFLIFLSERSIGKPWVKAELKKALMAEIQGVRADIGGRQTRRLSDRDRHVRN